MSTGTTPPSGRVAKFTERFPRNPLGKPSGGRSLGWLAALGIAIGLAIVALGCVPAGSLVPPATPSIASPVEGVIVSVDAVGLGDVRGFTLRPTTSAFSFAFTLGTLENPTEFPPSHLAEHQATSQPVRVYFRTENGVHTAYRLEDAAPPGS